MAPRRSSILRWSRRASEIEGPALRFHGDRRETEMPAVGHPAREDGLPKQHTGESDEEPAFDRVTRGGERASGYGLTKTTADAERSHGAKLLQIVIRQRSEV